VAVDLAAFLGIQFTGRYARITHDSPEAKSSLKIASKSTRSSGVPSPLIDSGGASRIRRHSRKSKSTEHPSPDITTIPGSSATSTVPFIVEESAAARSLDLSRKKHVTVRRAEVFFHFLRSVSASLDEVMFFRLTQGPRKVLHRVSQKVSAKAQLWLGEVFLVSELQC
jgi:hypothetical protein